MCRYPMFKSRLVAYTKPPTNWKISYAGVEEDTLTVQVDDEILKIDQEFDFLILFGSSKAWEASIPMFDLFLV
jgi:hypothetical protein